MSCDPKHPTIAFTTWFNDLVILDVWLKYYSQHFDELHIICSQTKDKYFPELDKRKEIYPLTYEIAEEPMEDVDTANRIICQKQHELVKDHYWVLYCNCDEIIAPDPKKYNGLKEFMRLYWGDWLPCEAFEIIEAGELPINFNEPILKQRTYCVRNVAMNKVLLSRVPLEWNSGQHQIVQLGGEKSKLVKDTGLYLFHLRHFNLTDEAERPRDFGPFLHSPSRCIMDVIVEKRFHKKIPKWVKELV